MDCSRAAHLGEQQAYRLQQAIEILTAMIAGIAIIQFWTVVPNRSKLPASQSPTIAIGQA
jgi:hypothetical protein